MGSLPRGLQLDHRFDLFGNDLVPRVGAYARARLVEERFHLLPFGLRGVAESDVDLNGDPGAREFCSRGDSKATVLLVVAYRAHVETT